MFLVLCVLFLNACTGNISETDDDKITVAATFYPVYIFTLNLVNGIEEINVKCMAEQSVGCLHDYTLTAKDAKLLSDAEVLVINGGGMESFLQDAFEGVDNLKVIDSSEDIEMLCGDEHHHDKAAHDHNHHENSHIWLSVDNAKIQIQNIKNGLVKEFPQYKNQIKNNYDEYIERLDALEKERTKLSAEVGHLSVISFHGAYEYLEKDLGLKILTTIESDEGSEPSAKELAHLSSEIKKDNVKALFIFPGYSGSAAEILARETGAGIYIINPVISGEEDLTAYEDIMRDNYKTILKVVK